MSASNLRDHLQRLLDENEPIIAGGCHFFVPQQKLCHRVRISSIDVVWILDLLGECHVRVGYHWQTTVRRLGPDFRMRAFLFDGEDMDTDMTEEATHLFALGASIRQRSAT